MEPSVLVYGWYGRGNVGDELMAQALRAIFARTKVQLRFVDRVDEQALQGCAAVIVGGGSMLHGRPDITDGALAMLTSAHRRPIFYVGVGTETAVDPVHAALAAEARAIFTRSPRAPAWAPHAIVVPDLVNLLTVASTGYADDGPVMVIPNVEVVPTWRAPHWSHVAWDRWKDELAQYLDSLVLAQVDVCFMTLCRNPAMDDTWPAHEILARMDRRSTHMRVLQGMPDIDGLVSEMSRCRLVITQRFHGAVVAAMAGVPCVVIDHHDKLRDLHPVNHSSVKYHGATKALIHEAVIRSRTFLPGIDQRAVRAAYDGFVDQVVSAIEGEKC